MGAADCLIAGDDVAVLLVASWVLKVVAADLLAAEEDVAVNLCSASKPNLLHQNVFTWSFITM